MRRGWAGAETRQAAAEAGIDAETGLPLRNEDGTIGPRHATDEGIELVPDFRVDGLTDEEGAVQDALLEAVAAWDELPAQHPNDHDEFYSAIHRLQDLLAVRIARREHPEGWPTHESPQGQDRRWDIGIAELAREEGRNG